MVAGFLTANSRRYRKEFLDLLNRSGPGIYIAFFTLTGASIRLDILADTWPIALILFGVRMFAIFTGSFLGGCLAGTGTQSSRTYWMAFITQAGVGLGLAKEVGIEFPQWGHAFFHDYDICHRPQPDRRPPAVQTGHQADERRTTSRPIPMPSPRHEK